MDAVGVPGAASSAEGSSHGVFFLAVPNPRQSTIFRVPPPNARPLIPAASIDALCRVVRALTPLAPFVAVARGAECNKPLRSPGEACANGVQPDLAR